MLMNTQCVFSLIVITCLQNITIPKRFNDKKQNYLHNIGIV